MINQYFTPKKLASTFICAAMFVLALSPVSAQIKQVSSLQELQKTIDRARAGDVITLKDGVYQVTEDIKITAIGKMGSPSP